MRALFRRPRRPRRPPETQSGLCSGDPGDPAIFRATLRAIRSQAAILLSMTTSRIRTKHRGAVIESGEMFRALPRNSRSEQSARSEVKRSAAQSRKWRKVRGRVREEEPAYGMPNASGKRELSCGDLFAGAGGLAVGFHMAGFAPTFFNELDGVAAATFKANFPKAVPFVCPIQELTAKKVQEACGLHGESLDVILGGPPCQGFSINAPVRSEDDPRNSLFRHYVRLVLEGLRPKIVVMENVPGMISFDGGRTIRSVTSAFEQAGYKMAFRILNAAHPVCQTGSERRDPTGGIRTNA